MVQVFKTDSIAELTEIVKFIHLEGASAFLHLRGEN